MSQADADYGATLNVDRETYRRIDDFARATAMSAGEVVRRAFEAYAGPGVTPPEDSVHEVLARAGLIGCLAGGDDQATDLATNLDHMKGFGGD